MSSGTPALAHGEIEYPSRDGRPNPPLQGFRRVGRELLPIEPDADGVFLSETLGLSLRLEDLRLVLVDLRTGERLLRFGELERAKRDAESARDEAEVRARAAEDELARLRAELARRGG